MTILLTGAVFALQLAASSSVSAQAVEPAAPSAHVQVPAGVFGAQTSVAQALRDQQSSGTSAASGEARLVCGLTVVPVDREVDSRFVHDRPVDTSFHVRRMSTGLCRDAAARRGDRK